MAEQFVKLTDMRGNPMLIPRADIRYVSVTEDGRTCVSHPWPLNPWHVKESPSEVLALLAGEKPDGIEDVVEKLRVDIAAWKRHVGRMDWCVLEGRITVTDLEKLVAYFDGRKTDA